VCPLYELCYASLLEARFKLQGRRRCYLWLGPVRLMQEHTRF